MKVVLALFALLLAAPLAAQETAVTPSGEKVILNPDGTWKYDTSRGGAKALPNEFVRPAIATAKEAINRGKSTLYYDPKKWKPKESDEAGRSAFVHVEGDGYAMVISERMEISLEALKNVAVVNARKVAPDVKITAEEKRRVNGKNLLALQMSGTIEGIPFAYYGYYYTGKEGTVQVIAFTTQNLLNEYRADFEDFLNGLAIEP
jgi:hypothetical protein